jgi:hypothetical protein
VICVLVASACTVPNEGQGEGEGEVEGVVDEALADLTCAVDSDCIARQLCLSGLCVFADCEPLLEDACDAGEVTGSHCCGENEACSPETFECEAEDVDPVQCDPADITCVECTSQFDCGGGEFCSSALCLSAAGRDACTSSFQCGDGEHCDRQAFLCVPKRPCAACSQLLPQLCCFEDELCLVDDEGTNDEGGVCVVPPPRECDVDEECAAGLFCGVTGQCVQCETTSDCGPGLTCDVEAGLCS